VRCWGFAVAPGSFRARQGCSWREYEYVFPATVLDDDDDVSNDTSSSSGDKTNSATAAVEAARALRLVALQGALAQFVGVHTYHNFTKASALLKGPARPRAAHHLAHLPTSPLPPPTPPPLTPGAVSDKDLFAALEARSFRVLSGAAATTNVDDRVRCREADEADEEHGGEEHDDDEDGATDTAAEWAAQEAYRDRSKALMLASGPQSFRTVNKCSVDAPSAVNGATSQPLRAVERLSTCSCSLCLLTFSFASQLVRRASSLCHLFCVFSATGVRFLRVRVRGCSFLYNQIRYMVGAAVAVARGTLPPWHLAAALRAPFAVPVPLAPPTGLLLVNAAFGSYPQAYVSYRRPATRGGDCDDDEDEKGAGRLSPFCPNALRAYGAKFSPQASRPQQERRPQPQYTGRRKADAGDVPSVVLMEPSAHAEAVKWQVSRSRPCRTASKNVDKNKPSLTKPNKLCTPPPNLNRLYTLPTSALTPPAFSFRPHAGRHHLRAHRAAVGRVARRRGPAGPGVRRGFAVGGVAHQ
jgi:tRNA U38,U39,U40 pseudouridine synthase TruA